MQVVNNYCNPFVNQFRESVQEFRSLSMPKKVATVAAGVFGALATFYLLGAGGVALFQLSVKWLKTGQSVAGEPKAEQIIKGEQVSTREMKINRLKSLIYLSTEERIAKAEREGYQVLSEEDLAGFTGKGFYIEGDEIYQGEVRNGKPDGKGILIDK